MKNKKDKELNALERHGLTIEELKLIKKLVGRGWKYPGEYSPRTVEAALQGRRFNAKILKAAYQDARKELKHCIRVMNKIDEKLNSNK